MPSPPPPPAVRAPDPSAPPRLDLEQLRRQVRALEGGAGRAASGAALESEPTAGSVASGWPSIDAGGGQLPAGLARGVVHEWLGLAALSKSDEPPRRAGWTPPLFVMAHLARAGSSAERRPVLWLGRRVWPYPAALSEEYCVAERGGTELKLALERHAVDDSARGALLERSLFVDVDDEGERLWAIDLALRCRSLDVVVADGRGFDMIASRRLQLAAEAGGALALIVRPPWEVNALSAASTRWRVRRARGAEDACLPSWTLELLRAKGARARIG